VIDPGDQAADGTGSPKCIWPDWDVPGNITALVTTRGGKSGHEPYDSFNLALHVGDDPERVAGNRTRLKMLVPGLTAIQWVNQTHGTGVVTAVKIPALKEPEADAVYLNQPGVSAAILTADCLPVFIASCERAEAAIVHAGWRGLAGGIIENTIARFEAAPAQLVAWLGPAIGPCHFEVGEDVRSPFIAWGRRNSSFAAEVREAFSSTSNPGKWRADLYALARLRLRAAGILRVGGGHYCTVCDQERFYSYRRDGVTGRMASLIHIKPV
jgi:polyphenol oxidase